MASSAVMARANASSALVIDRSGSTAPPRCQRSPVAIDDSSVRAPAHVRLMPRSHALTARSRGLRENSHRGFLSLVASAFRHPMHYDILGSLVVRDGARTVALAQGRQRLLVAILLLNANEPVHTE